MNVIVDVGNSFLKLAVFDNVTLVEKVIVSEKEFPQQLKSLQKAFPKLDHAIVSSVGNFSEKHLAVLKKHLKVHILSNTSKLPFDNKYKTPNTLGVDRIALVCAAAVQFPKKNVLIIDAGSCITYDFLNTKNEYLGGAISPGISMRFKAMNAFTANLPLVEKKNPERFIGNSTQSSMNVGVVNGVVHEIEGFISMYKAEFSDLTTILTGGDTHFLLDSIKNDIFANSNFLLEGLNHILEINKDSF